MCTQTTLDDLRTYSSRPEMTVVVTSTHWGEDVNDELIPHPTAVHSYEQNGTRYRIYLTRNGSIASDRYDNASGTWQHLPLRDADRHQLAQLLAVRYHSDDEAIARTIASLCGSTPAGCASRERAGVGHAVLALRR